MYIAPYLGRSVLGKDLSVNFCNTYHKSVVPFLVALALDSAGDEEVALCHYKLVSHHVNRIELSIISNSSKGKRIDYPSSPNT